MSKTGAWVIQTQNDIMEDRMEPSLAKHNIRGTVRVKTYSLMQNAIEIGVTRGWRRAHKHTDTPDELCICDAIENAILEEIDERFEFDSGCTCVTCVQEEDVSRHE